MTATQQPQITTGPRTDAPPDDAPATVAGAAGNSARILVLRRIVTMVMFAGSTLVLARTLSVSSFGAYAGSLATLQLAIAASDLGFSSVLLRELPARPGDAARRMRMAVGTMSLWSVAPCLLLFGLAFLQGVDNEEGEALLIFAPGMLFAGLALYRVPFLVLYRTRELARMDLVLATLQTVAVMAAAIVVGDVWAVAAAMVITTVLTVLVVALRGRRLLVDTDDATPTRSRRALVRAAAPLGVASLLSSLYFSIDLVLLGWLVDPEEVGLYAVAVKILNLLVTIPGTIAPAVLPGLAVMIGREKLGEMTGRVWHWLMFAAVPPCLLVAAFPEFILLTLFGDPYVDAAPVLRLLALAGVGSALATTLNVLLVVLDKGIPQLKMNLVVLVLNVGANIVLVPAHGIEAAAAITLATEVLVCAAALVLLRRHVAPGPALAATVRPALAIGLAIGIALLTSGVPGVQLAIAVVAYGPILVLSGGWPHELRPRRPGAPHGTKETVSTRAIRPKAPRPTVRNLTLEHAGWRGSSSVSETPGEHVKTTDPLEQRRGTTVTENVEASADPAEPMASAAPAAPTAAPSPRRSRMHLLVLVPFVVAVIVFIIGSAVPTRYSATSLVRVTVFAPDGPTDPTVGAENGIAAQYALLATTPPVIDGAARRLGVPRATIEDAISAGTDSGRNLITIRASGEDRAAVAKQADAVADQLVRSANANGQRATARYTAEIEARNRPLDGTIETYRKLIATGPVALRNSRSQALAALLTERQRQQSGTVTSAVASVPSLQVWARAGSPATDGLSPVVYAAVGFFVAALLVGYAAYLMRIRRREHP